MGSLKRVAFNGSLHKTSGKHFKVLPAKFGITCKGAVGESHLEHSFKLVAMHPGHEDNNSKPTNFTDWSFTNHCGSA